MLLFGSAARAVSSPSAFSSVVGSASPVGVGGGAAVRWALTAALALVPGWSIRRAALAWQARHPGRSEEIFFALILGAPFAAVAAAALTLLVHAAAVRTIRSQAHGAVTLDVGLMLGLMLAVMLVILVPALVLAFRIRMGRELRAAAIPPGRALIWLGALYGCLLAAWGTAAALGLHGLMLVTAIAVLSYAFASAGLLGFVALRCRPAGPELEATQRPLLRRLALGQTPLTIHGRGGRGVANAIALGPTRALSRIVVTASLLALLDDEELSAVLAHEAGHLRLRHLQRLGLIGIGAAAAAGAAIILGGPPLERLGGSMVGGAARVLLGMLLPTIGIPLVLARAYRGCEREADAFAVRAGYGRALRSALRKMAAHNGDSPQPQAIASWFALHPPVDERLRAAIVEAAPSADRDLPPR